MNFHLLRFGFSLIVLSCALLSANLAVAQTQDAAKPNPEVQQLKDKLQQLEQTVEELKGQLKAVADSQKKTEALATGEKVAVPTDTALVNTPSTVTAPPASKSSGDQPAGESTFSVYGFAMLDAG